MVGADVRQPFRKCRMRNIDSAGNVPHMEFTGGSDIDEQPVMLVPELLH